MNKLNNIKAIGLLAFIIVVLAACKPDEADFKSPSFSNNPDVFIDNFSSGLQYAVFQGASFSAFDVTSEVTYGGSASAMRFAVPEVNSSDGSYAGGTFFVGDGRDLSGYNALTFYAKATKSATIDAIGFGISFGEDLYEVSTSIDVNTNWKKYYIPIPDASKLSSEKGLLYFAEGPENGLGYTFWLDEIKFEKTGLLAHPRATIMGGDDVVKLAYQGIDVNIENVSYSINLPDGVFKDYNIQPGYFSLSSGNESVVQIDADNKIKIVGPGLALIKGYIDGVEADGSLTLNVQGSFSSAPAPIYDQANVVSLYSDHYNNVPVDFFNGYWEPFQTTRSEDFAINGDNILNYVEFNFVGNQFSNPTVDASAMTHLHLDLFIPVAVQSSTSLNITIRDFGPDGTDGGGDDADIIESFTDLDLSSGVWNSIDIPLNGLSSKNALGLLIYEGNELPNFFLDNVFFYN